MKVQTTTYTDSTTRTALLVAALALLFLASPAARASVVVQPCVSNASTDIDLLPLSGGGQTYCQSAYAWTDTWFPTSQPPLYAGALDVFSGNDAAGLRWEDMPDAGNDYDFFTPWLDGNALDAELIGSNWQVDDFTVAGNTSSSSIFLGPMTVDIETTVATDVRQTFTFTNTHATETVRGLRFFDYFNFHPNGTTVADVQCGTTSVVGGTVFTTGLFACGDGPEVSAGIMYGSLAPIAFDVADAGVLLARIAADALLGDAGPVGPGNTAGVLVWGFGDLAPGESASMTVYKYVIPAPEPASALLLAGALVALGLRRRQR